MDRSVAATWSGSSSGAEAAEAGGGLTHKLADEAAGADLVLGGLKALRRVLLGPAQTGGDA